MGNIRSWRGGEGDGVVDKIVSLPKNSRDLPTERAEMTVVVVSKRCRVGGL
jgi:hypothetical protein